MLRKILIVAVLVIVMVALEGLTGELKKGDPASLKNPRGKRYAYRPDEIELMAPVPRPGKIIHTACNFPAHLKELTTWKEPVKSAAEANIRPPPSRT